MNITKSLLFFIILFASLNLEAQTNFVKGYYITQQHDTVRGYLEYRTEHKKSRVCVFKSDLKSKPVTFGPYEVLGVSFEDKDFYETHSFKGRTGNEELGFFKVILRGKLSLLRYDSRYFVRKESGEMYEITKRYVVTDGISRADLSGFGVLKTLMNDCSDITEGYLKDQYAGNPHFKDIFIKYNRCSGSTFTESRDVQINPHFNFGLQAAANYCKLEFRGVRVPLSSVSFDNEVVPSFGVFASIFLPRVNERFRLVVEANYHEVERHSNFQFSTALCDLYVNYSLLRVPVIMRYGGRFFVEAAVMPQFVINESTNWSIYDGTLTNEQTALKPLNALNIGYLVGAGMQFRFSGFALRSFVRYSKNSLTGSPYKPVFQNFEAVFALQLMK
jgi:hypothetical protein